MPHYESIEPTASTTTPVILHPPDPGLQDCDRPPLGRAYISRDWATAASMKEVNRGCGAKGLDFSSGWNWTPMNQG